MSRKFQTQMITTGNSRFKILLGTAIASSLMVGGIAQAENTTTFVDTGANFNANQIDKSVPSQDVSGRSSSTDTATATSVATSESILINQINQEVNPVSDIAQNVTSVSQLSDVKPTDWAFTALQSLVERYGCIAGYPDSTFRGNQATSRYEFAAGLNACLDKINEIISAGLSDKVSQEDLATLQKLQEEFASELAILRGRVDALDAKTAKLEAQQFSVTTKLFGQAIFGLQGRANNSPSIFGAKTPDNATNVTFGGNVQLSLFTQLDPRSSLLTGLSIGNLSTAATGNNALNNSFTRLGYEFFTGANGNSVVLSDLSYRSLIADNFAIIAGPVGVSPVTVFRGPDRYQSAGQGAVSLFAQRNPILNLGNTTSGVGFDWQIAERTSLQAVYSAGNAQTAAGNGGLFGGNYTLGAQFVFAPVKPVDVALYYLRSYTSNAGTTNTQLGLLGTGVGDDIVAISPGGGAVPVSTDAFGSTINWRALPTLNLGGWVGFTSSTVSGLTGSVQTFNWMSYLTFPDLFKEGNLGGIYVGQLPKITGSSLSGNSNVPDFFGNPLSPTSGTTTGGQSTSTTQLELFYRHRISNNISITPGLIFLFNPGNRVGSDTTTIGVLRTTFSF
ncbi:iron uptake porin [Pseudanabaena mucicola]|uniref:Carbohydrate porin n=1 Tax=Pseudanabaena mucicola FACHB-723 TaxID=2692860 RepID=A0ABR8A076_9CYAN|nr:iron uptake porin [Pseudanabaena mucicola]MBD2188757.1 carbohydrate porin [Pseudanabaena mucicola FACHB-723]